MSNLGAGIFRNCCIEGGSSSGGISIAKSSGGSSPFVLSCVLSSPTSSILPLLLASLSILTSGFVSCESVFVSVAPAPLPRPRGLSPIHELFIPRPFPEPRSSVSRPSPLCSIEPLLPSSSASEDSSSRLPPNCLLDLCSA